MELFVTNDAVSVLEARMAGVGGQPRLPDLVELAWHLRQRDSARALLLASEADLASRQHVQSIDYRSGFEGRLALVRAEIELLFANMEAAQAGVEAAARAFDEASDLVGQGDAHWLRASIAVDRGRRDEMDACLQSAVECYRLAGDQVRVEQVLARRLIYRAFRDPVATDLLWRQDFPPDRTFAASVMVYVAAARGTIATLTNDQTASVGFYLQSYHAALDSGQIRQAAVSLSNAVESMVLVGDVDAALDHGERSLTLARGTGWPGPIGLCLYRVGDVMRLLGRHAEARDYLEESLEAMRASAGSRNYELVVSGLGQLALDTGEADAALEWFNEFERHARLHPEPDSLMIAWQGQACALLLLGRSSEALMKARAALESATRNGNGDGRIQALQVMSRIHAASDDATADPGQGARLALLDLQQAVEIAATITGYSLTPELLGALASAYATVGDFQSAYTHLAAADQARRTRHSEEVQRRASAMQVRQEVDKARAVTEHHRQLSTALAETAATLEALGVIGREITASLSAMAVFDALKRHVNQLLDVTTLLIYLIDSTGQTLSCAFGIEAGVEITARTIPLHSRSSNVARCVRERQDLLLDVVANPHDPNLIPGTLNTLSLLYAPLMIGARVLGAMTIQSVRAQAYGARERSIFRALCAYGAIALDNAAAYATAEAAQRQADAALGQLRETQVQLIEQNHQLELLAVTDRLTGLYNRLRLDQTLEQERARCARYGTLFSVIIIDVDHFKSVNDTYGHQVGDLVLIDVARILSAGTRTVDVLGRWGGEEFLVICYLGQDGALLLAEKLRRAIEVHRFTSVGHKTASFGIARYRAGEQVSETIGRADAALYRAKQGGRNRVEFAD